MKNLKGISFYLFSVIILSSCVSSKKFDAANAQISGLNSQVETLNQKVAADDKEIAQLKTENIQYGREAEDCRKAKAAIAQRFDNINNALAAKGTSMQQIRANVEKALQTFEDQGATVTYRNGLVHINFEDDFFFKSGSSTIATKGREALNTVAQVLRENPGVTCIIVGNTDDQKAKGRDDNWPLSTERAVSVVRILANTYNINPARLTAAGKSEFNPVASNATPEGREKNRRIEIILNPDLSRLWELSEGK
jgi:chemotaxis protein MotB